MQNSICYQALGCGLFGLSCTNERRLVDCGGPIRGIPVTHAIDILNELLPIPKIGICKICSVGVAPVYAVNGSYDACIKCFIEFILQNRPMPELSRCCVIQQKTQISA
jgi:hypothetical protein